MKLVKWVRGLFGQNVKRVRVEFAPPPKAAPVRRSRAEVTFANSKTEEQILYVLSMSEPATVSMVRGLLSQTTIAQAMPQMWKRGVLVRRRANGSNTYWYARSEAAFTKEIQRSPIRFTGTGESWSQRMDREWGKRTATESEPIQ